MRTKQRERVSKTRRRICIFILIFLFVFLMQFALQQIKVKGYEGISGDRTAGIMDHGWNLILVNAEYKVPWDWNMEPVELFNGETVDSRIYPALQRMFDDMRAQGIYPVVVSGYRSAEEQRELMHEKIDAFRAQGYSYFDAKKEAEKWVSSVGYSEHQTGLAVDINADRARSGGEQVYGWLAGNAHKYGFIKRYPSDKTEITGISNEPWHYRYVGETAAKKIKNSGLCLEEYVAQLGI